jgi:hypothetical protein
MEADLDNIEPVEIYCKLQYRILPNEDWITVAERTF